MIGCPRSLLRLLASAASLALLVAGVAEGQVRDTLGVEPDTVPAADAEPGAPAPRAVSPLLPPDHWAVAAVARAQALGLVDGWLPAQRAVPRLVVGEALRRAAERAATGDPRLAAMARGWRARFVEEFGGEAEDDAVVRPLGVSARAGYTDWTERLTPARGYYEGRVEPQPLADVDDVRLGGSFAAGLGNALAVLVEAGSDGGAPRLDRWEAAAGWRNLTLSVGEMPAGYGVARGGGLLLTNATFPRAELRTERPVRLPSLLRHLGPVSAHATVTRLEESRHLGDPYFLTMRAAFQPHPRFTVGINRAAMFGGDLISTPVTVGNVARMFIGVLSREFENQEVSVDGRFRLPSEAILPLTLYLEWGSEDAAGAWWDVPGIVAGAFAPALPGLPQVGVGAEYTHFSPICCGNPPWYSHAAFPGGWVLDDRPLGHPLGGEGSEALVYAVADLLDARLRVEGRAFARDRGSRGLATPQRAANLFAPARAGASHGGNVSVAWRLLARSELRASWFRDAGDGWREQRLAADLSYFF